MLISIDTARGEGRSLPFSKDGEKGVLCSLSLLHETFLISAKSNCAQRLSTRRHTKFSSIGLGVATGRRISELLGYPNAPDIQRQFQKFEWYHPKPALTFEEVDRMMSDTEKQNVKFLAHCRELKRSK